MVTTQPFSGSKKREGHAEEHAEERHDAEELPLAAALAHVVFGGKTLPLVGRIGPAGDEVLAAAQPFEHASAGAEHEGADEGGQARHGADHHTGEAGVAEGFHRFLEGKRRDDGRRAEKGDRPADFLALVMGRGVDLGSRRHRRSSDSVQASTPGNAYPRPGPGYETG